MRRSPFAPLLNFLHHDMADKDSIWSGKWGQPLLQPNTRQDELCTTMAWLGMARKKPIQPRFGPLHGHEACRQQLQPDTSQTHCRSSVPLARVAFDCLALPCLALPCLAFAALLRWVRVQVNICIAKKSSPSIS